LLIIFDLDDTLIDTSGSIIPYKLQSALRVMVAQGLQLPDFRQALEMMTAMDAKSDSTLDTLKEFLEIHDVEGKFLQIAYDEVYVNKIFEYDVLPTKSAIEVIVDLSKKHTLAIVSAGIKEIQMEKLKKAGIDTSVFSRIVICEAFNKKFYYQQLIEDLKVSPLEVVVCGDRVKRDLLPGKALGFKTIHMKWGRGVHQKGELGDIDFTIDSLDQLRPIIMQFENHEFTSGTVCYDGSGK
jgi:putative hydrolase of the HAD superfamily